MYKKYLNLLIIASGLTLTGCASNASFNQMIAHPNANQTPRNKSLIQGIAVDQVTGGRETNMIGTSQVDNTDFKTALVQSLKEANLYHELDGTKYILNANLVKLQQPALGLNLTVVSEVNYNLQDARNKATVYNQNIVAAYTAHFSDSFLAVTRLKMANEGSMKANIRRFMDDLYQLPKTKG